MKYKGKPTGRPADFYVIGLVIGGAVFWSLTYFQKSLVALYQLIAVIMIGVSLYLLIRYRLTSFLIKIEGRNGAETDINTAMPEELDFVVERIRGKTSVVLARLSLSDLKRAETVQYGRLRELTEGASLYRYQANMSPEEGVLLLYRSSERDVAIFTDMSSEMLSFLKVIVERNLRVDSI